MDIGLSANLNMHGVSDIQAGAEIGTRSRYCLSHTGATLRLITGVRTEYPAINNST